MERHRRIVLCGTSLLMAGVKASLLPYADLQITEVDEERWQRLRPSLGTNVDAVVFDLSSDEPQFVLELIKHFPGVLLIGIDASRDRALVLSSQQPQVLTVQELVQAITAPGTSVQEPQSRATPVERRVPILSELVAWVCARPRRQKLSLAFVGTSLCAALLLLSLSVGQKGDSRLLGASVWDAWAPGIGLGFGVGLVLCGIAIAVWFLVCRKKGDRDL